MNSVKILHAVRSAITATAKLLVHDAICRKQWMVIMELICKAHTSIGLTIVIFTARQHSLLCRALY